MHVGLSKSRVGHYFYLDHARDSSFWTPLGEVAVADVLWITYVSACRAMARTDKLR